MKNILEHTPQILPIASEAEFELCIEEAKKDHHGVLWPTHIIWKKPISEDGNNYQVAGAISIGRIPLVTIWLSKQYMSSRDSQMVASCLNNFARMQGWLGYAVPCEKTSPLHPVMGGFGFDQVGGDMNLFYQNLKKGF